VRHEALYFAMLNGASDSTPGDRAFAGAVYVIARQEKLPVATDLMARRFKVDEVPRSSLPKNAEGMYNPSASSGGRKGDTMYLPSDMNFLSLEGQATVVHELTHTAQDAEKKVPERTPVVEAEQAAFVAEASFYLDAIAKRHDAGRERAVVEIAKAVRLPSLLCAVLVATEVRGNETALAALKELHAQVVIDGDPKTWRAFDASDFAATLAGLQNPDDDRHWEAMKKLEKRIEKAIADDYSPVAPALDDGFRGESVLDIPVN
jgi:hypothetical protein